MNWLTGYAVYYQDKVLEEMRFDEDYWLEKTDDELEEYRAELWQFFAQPLIEEGKSKEQVTDYLQVVLYKREYILRRKDKIIHAWLDSENMKMSEVKKVTGYGLEIIRNTITEYLRKRKQDGDIKDTD